MILSRRLLVAVLLSCLMLPGLVRAEDKPNDAIVPVPRDGGWMKRHESFNERVKKGNVDLLFIGDSITQGWEGAGKERLGEVLRQAERREPGHRRRPHAARPVAAR